MASLDKLAIRGIRSFDDKTVSIIEFYTPVTVIVGHNGSGKTTIIECLKYITTGDQPPNTRGGAFIHDPKMANEKEVKAQVRLRFFAANGARMLATRNLSVSVRKTGLTMKTLEGLLGTADEAGNRRSTISTKCAEMDIEIPRLLGVSKAVLENVIFCHQEDSYWPLAEASALKKKFDDIFEATKYTKALDSIKALRKERVADLKADKEKMESLKLEKSRADKMRGQVSTLQNDIAERESQLEDLKQQCEELGRSNRRFYEQATKYKETLLKADSLDERREFLQRQADDVQTNIKEIVDDDNLDAKIANFEQRLAQQDGRRRKLTDDLQDEDERLQTYRKKHVKAITQQGQLMAEKQAYNRHLTEREELVGELASKHRIRGYDQRPLETSKVEDFIRQLGDLQAAQDVNTEQIKAEKSSKISEFDSRLRKLYNEKAADQQLITNDRNRIAALKATLAKLEGQLDSSRMVDADLRRVNSDVVEGESKLRRLQDDLSSSNFDTSIAEKTKALRVLDDDRERIDREFQALNVQAESRAKLSSKESELHRKRELIRTTLQSINGKCRQLTGREPQEDTVESDLTRAMSENETTVFDAERTNSDAIARLKQIETTKARLEQDLRQTKEEISSGKRKISEGRGEHPTLDAAVQAKAIELDTEKSQRANTKAAIDFFSLVKSKGLGQHHCVGCNRALKSEDLKAFETYITRRIDRLSVEDDEEETEGVITGLTQELETLQDLQRSSARVLQMESADVPNLTKEIASYSEKLEEARVSSESAESRLNRARADQRELVNLRATATQIARAVTEASDLQREVDQLQEILSAGGSSRSLDEVRLELDRVVTEAKAMEKVRQDLSVERERSMQEQRAAEKYLHGLQLRQRDIQDKIKDRVEMERRGNDARKEISGLETHITELTDKVAHSKEPIDQLEVERSQLDKSLTTSMDESARVAQTLLRSVDRLRTTNKPIDQYIRERKERSLEQCNEQITEMEAQIVDANSTLENIRNSVTQLDKEMGERTAVMSNLKDNVRLRQAKREIATVVDEIQKLPLEDMKKAHRNFEEQYAASKEKENAANARRAHIGGEVTSMKSQLSALMRDLATDYKDIDKRYTDQLVKVKMSDLANNDLEKYAKALDQAIMQYHALKMEEVNDTMKHLWNRTYQGTDIDGIKIRSDSEGGASKRSYNYRVVMTKDQVEMDMRGRCSAGQKMLASIIIRLSLSDSFGQNCGILALDEPTNALDTENIDALAASLADLIAERRNNSNFQLIVITHDEKFLRKLATSDVMEYYWRVSRDSRQKSVIERNKIN